jgi:hypothetical protein
MFLRRAPLHSYHSTRGLPPLLQPKFNPDLIFKEKHILPYPDSSDQTPRIAILGGGISGLASAYYARKYFPYANIFIIEKGEAGGMLNTVTEGGFVCE